jgi:3-phenylpropionate/trans-cinnamate dioxygenase ferredoxin reductase subunit
MPDSTYLIVGGGMTAAAAARGIREVDPDGSIGLIGTEPEPPYKRPLLSKGLWSGKPLDKVWSNTSDCGLDLHLGRTARWLDPRAKRVVDDRGTVYGFDKLLLATGVRPRHLPIDDPGIVYFRTLQDYRRLRQLAGEGRRIVVIGGGFIGSELAAALASNGTEVVMIFPEPAIGGRLFPADLAFSLNDSYRERGVEVLAGTTVVDVETRGDQSVVQLRTASGGEREILVDGLVAGIGTEPNVELARSSGLTVEDGIVVDRFLRTNQPDVYAAGDVANFCVVALGERRRIEHEDNAKTMGQAAGRAMAGVPEPYDHLPFFYSDLFDLGYEAVGDVDARLETVVDWTEPYRTGVVYYLQEGRVRGVLLWNVWGRVAAARELIGQPGPFGPDDLVGQIAPGR